MTDRADVLTVGSLVGRTVVSLSTGNKLGVVRDVFLDPLNGRILGIAINSPAGEPTILPFDSVHSFGRDAIMADRDDALLPAEHDAFAASPNIRDLNGIKILTETGMIMGHIAEIYVTATGTPVVFYEVRESLLDALLGRRRFIPASAAHALSDDRQRLIVPAEAAEDAVGSIDELLSRPMTVQTFRPFNGAASADVDETVVVLPPENEDETVVRDGDETVLRLRPTRT